MGRKIVGVSIRDTERKVGCEISSKTERVANRKTEFEQLFLGQVVQLDRGYPLVEIDENSNTTESDTLNDLKATKEKTQSNRTNVRVRCEYSIGMLHKNCVVGDIVYVRVPDTHDNGVIVEVRPRTRELVRKDPAEQAISQVLAANFDTVFIVQPVVDVNFSRLLRELVVAHQSGAKVVVLLTKADLVSGGVGCDDGRDGVKCDEAQYAIFQPKTDIQKTLSLVRELAGENVDVLTVSTGDTRSVEAVRKLVPANTLAVMVGRSGAGKSSLINALVGERTRAVNEVRQRDGRGRHTTVNRTIVRIPGAGSVVDMPGVRGLGMWEAEEGLIVAFPDITELATECKFRDCKHESEPGCRVREAVVNGQISQERLNAYLTLMSEINKQRSRKEQKRRASGRKKSDKPATCTSKSKKRNKKGKR